MQSPPILPKRLRFHARPRPPIQCKTQPDGRLVRVRSNGDWEAESDPSSRYAYDLDMLYITQWHIGAYGVLRPLSPEKVEAHSHPIALTFHPSGHFAYVSCSHGALCQYRVHAGALIPMNPRQVYADSDPSPMWFDATGIYACVITPGVDGGSPANDRIYLYKVGRDGRLELRHVIDINGPDNKISRAAWAKKISTFIVSGDRLGY